MAHWQDGWQVGTGSWFLSICASLLGLLGLPHSMVAGMQEWASQESGSGCSQFLKVTVQELALCYSTMFS